MLYHFKDALRVGFSTTPDLHVTLFRGGGNLSRDTEGVLWHALEITQVAERLGADPERGLSDKEAAARLHKFGHNRIREEKRTHPFMLFLRQFGDFMIYVLIAAALISGVALKEYIDAAVIMFIVVANAVLGFIQEYRAEKALESLRRLSAPTARVLREGRQKSIPSRDLVPGDLILLEAGDHIPADARLVQAFSLRADEASLTGESEAVEKNSSSLPSGEIPLGERLNMVYTGTHIVHGRGSALVVATGRKTQLGQIAEMIGEAEEEKTPLQQELARTGKKIALLCLGICAFIFILGVLRNLEWSGMLLFSVSLAVAAIPEGLPAIVTIALALGVRRMAEQKALLRRLPAVETLGCADVICTDKTGTLTRNEMEVLEIRLPQCRPIHPDSAEKENPEGLEVSWPLLATAVLCNDARMQGKEILGEGTEVALIHVAERLSFPLDEAIDKYRRVEEIPFESERKLMSTIHAVPDPGPEDSFFPFASFPFMLLSKGAPEAILKRCSRVLTPHGVRNLPSEERMYYADWAEEMADKALRTLAFACRPLEEIPPDREAGKLESDLIFLGIAGMMDPPRPEVFQALEMCRRANIEVVMITGDHASTARAIATELSILTPQKEMVVGEELARMSEEELAERVENIAVYARVSPADKVKIVRAWKNKGKVVAMTGDGVNDAPALKNADIGVAMGITGTDVSKEASDMVLADDNFATIVGAVAEGRVIYDNLKKFIYFLLSCNMSEVSTMFLAMLITSTTPLSAVEVLWMNLVTDGFPAMALGVDTPAPDVMSRPPRDPSEGILSWRKQMMIIWQGLVLSAGALAAFFVAKYALFSGLSSEAAELRVHTMVFTTLVFSQLLHAFNSRSERLSFTQMPLFDNKALLAALAVSLLLQLAVILIPPLMRLFGTAYLDGTAWGVILACSIIPVLLIDRIKAKKQEGVRS
jgi:Ca2+-transporting ATPase